MKFVRFLGPVLLMFLSPATGPAQAQLRMDASQTVEGALTLGRTYHIAVSCKLTPPGRQVIDSTGLAPPVPSTQRAARTYLASFGLGGVGRLLPLPASQSSTQAADMAKLETAIAASEALPVYAVDEAIGYRAQATDSGWCGQSFFYRHDDAQTPPRLSASLLASPERSDGTLITALVAPGAALAADIMKAVLNREPPDGMTQQTEIASFVTNLDKLTRRFSTADRRSETINLRIGTTVIRFGTVTVTVKFTDRDSGSTGKALAPDDSMLTGGIPFSRDYQALRSQTEVDAIRANAANGTSCDATLDAIGARAGLSETDEAFIALAAMRGRNLSRDQARACIGLTRACSARNLLRRDTPSRFLRAFMDRTLDPAHRFGPEIADDCAGGDSTFHADLAAQVAAAQPLRVKAGRLTTLLTQVRRWQGSPLDQNRWQQAVTIQMADEITIAMTPSMADRIDAVVRAWSAPADEDTEPTDEERAQRAWALAYASQLDPEGVMVLVQKATATDLATILAGLGLRRFGCQIAVRGDMNEAQAVAVFGGPSAPQGAGTPAFALVGFAQPDDAALDYAKAVPVHYLIRDGAIVGIEFGREGVAARDIGIMRASQSGSSACSGIT